MSKCYGWKGRDGGGNLALFLACATNPGWGLNPIYKGLKHGKWYYPTDNGQNITWSDYGAETIGISAINSQAELQAWADGNNYAGSCDFCLGQCPPNHIKCKSDKPPGYCCIPCAEVQGGIASITAALRNIK
jgi:hypothetical protein